MEFSKDEIQQIICKQLEEKDNQNIKEWGVKHFLEVPKDETYRTNFRRHRDKILYTGGFRRLQDKTQVISAAKHGDHRTRLTHTMEVEQIAISLSDALGLNRDLVSAIAIGHDIGHTPFGHAVESLLDEKLSKVGGFSHALQSVKYLNDKIKEKDNDFNLIIQNLIFEGIVKHDSDVYAGKFTNKQIDCLKYNLDEAGVLEMQVVYWADKIAYLTHDLEDFLSSEIYVNAKKNNPNLENEIKELLAKLIPTKHDEILDNIEKYENRDLLRSVIRNLLDNSISNIRNIFIEANKKNEDINCDYFKNASTQRIKEAEKKFAIQKAIDGKEISLGNILKLKENINDQIEELDNTESKEVRKKLEEKIKCNTKKLEELQDVRKDAFNEGLVINFSDEYREYFIKLRKKLTNNYIMSPEIARSDAKAKNIAQSLFNMFIENPKILPINIQKLIDEKDTTSKKRVVADYIASMTDRYAEAVYSDLNAIGGHYAY